MTNAPTNFPRAAALAAACVLAAATNAASADKSSPAQELFDSCAYSRTNAAGLRQSERAKFQLRTQQNLTLGWDLPFRAGQPFSLEVTSPVAGFLYLLQDDPADPVFAIPGPVEHTHQVPAGKATVFPSRGNHLALKPPASNKIRVGVAVAPEKLPAAALKLSFDDAVRYLKDRAHCGVTLEEHELKF
jgi:hypothetical protein